MGAMAVTRTKAEEFRRLAQECRATAQTLSTEQARAEMLAMADVCDRVAAQPTHWHRCFGSGAGGQIDSVI
jgi:pyruvate-formate lyase